MLAKGIVSAAMCFVIGLALYVTKNPMCLWGLTFVWFLW